MYNFDYWDWHNYVGLIDLILPPIYIGLILFLAYRTKKKYIEEFPLYKYFVNGLFFKIGGGIFFSLIYIFYYKTGDPTNYFMGARAISKVFFKDPSVTISLLFGNNSNDNWTYFDVDTGFPIQTMYMLDPGSFAVSRFSSPFLFLSFNSFICGVILLDYFLYKFIWRFYMMFCELYPGMEKQLAIAILFVPSVAFWGSGYMKDTFTLASALYFTYNFYNIFIKKKDLWQNIIAIIINALIMITLKPYVFVALLLPSVVWGTYGRIKSIQNQTVRIFVTPFLIVISLSVGLLAFSSLGSRLGAYGSTDKILMKAQVTQQDLSREAYGAHSFNIGKFDPSIKGVLSKSPVAITAGLYRPFIWESGNVVMLLSGLENFVLLALTLFVWFKVGPFKTIRYIAAEPLLLFSVIFSIIMAFAIGLTSANFGALVRYKIPVIPFFVSTLFILYQKTVRDKKY